MRLNGKNIYLSFLKGKSFEHKGDFDATAIYQSTSQIIDCVFYQGVSYYCKKTTTAGINPTNTEYWGILASGNLPIDSELSSTSLNPVQNKVIASELAKKQDKLTLVTEYNISSDLNSITISNLNLKTNEIYDIYIVANSNASADISFKINDISSGYRYLLKQSYWYDGQNPNITAKGAVSDSGFKIGTSWATLNKFHINLINMGSYYAINSQELGMDSTTTNYIRDCNGIVNASGDITKLKFELANSSFKSGGKILIYKRT